MKQSEYSLFRTKNVCCEIYEHIAMLSKLYYSFRPQRNVGDLSEFGCIRTLKTI
jgi:hypothetical protein